MLLHTTYCMAHVVHTTIFTHPYPFHDRVKTISSLSLSFPSRRTSIVLIFGWFDKCYELSSVVGTGSITTAKNANQIENEDGEDGILFLSLSSRFLLLSLLLLFSLSLFMCIV